MNVFISILRVAALIFFVLATFSVPSPPRLNYVAAGLACLALAALLGHGTVLGE
jgi:hypothetical protein